MGRSETISKTLLQKNGLSFEKWCIENNRQDILDRWDYELNGFFPSEICAGSQKKCYFKCPINKHPSISFKLDCIYNNHTKLLKCTACNSFANWAINNICEDFFEKYWDYEKNTEDPWKISYGSRRKYIWIKCQNEDYHGSYKTNCNNFINENRCPNCCNHKGNVHHLDSLGYKHPLSVELWSDKNKKSAFEYAEFSGCKVWFKYHNGKHEDSLRTICNAILRDFYCPICSRERDESILQKKVKEYIEDLGYSLLHESKCNLKCYNQKTGNLLRYDNEIVELKLICEVHGIQHYSITNFHNMSARKFNTTPQYELEYIQIKDEYKKNFALINGYNYVEIPYWTDNKKESWKLIIDNKIKEIKEYALKEVV